MAGMGQDDPGPHQARDRPEARQAGPGQRPRLGEVALVRRERPPEAVLGNAVEPGGEQGGMHRPPLRPPAGDLGLPAGAAAGAVAADPVEHPGLAERPGGAVADRGEIVEPQAGLPFGLEARVGEGRRPDRAAAGRAPGRNRVPERPPAPAEQVLPALGVAEQDRLRQGRRDLGRPAEPGPVRPQAVAPGARSADEAFAEGLERQSGLRHLPGTAPKIAFARTLASGAADCHAKPAPRAVFAGAYGGGEEGRRARILSTAKSGGCSVSARNPATVRAELQQERPPSLSVAVFAVDPAEVAVPFAAVAGEELVRGGLAPGHDLVERAEEVGLVGDEPAGAGAGAGAEAGLGDPEDVARHVEQRPPGDLGPRGRACRRRGAGGRAPRRVQPLQTSQAASSAAAS